MCVCIGHRASRNFSSFYSELLIKVVEPYWLIAASRQVSRQANKQANPLRKHVNIIKPIHEIRSPKKAIVKLDDEKNVECELIEVIWWCQKRRNSRLSSKIQWTFKIIGVSMDAACSLIRKHKLLRNAKVFWNSYRIRGCVCVCHC